MTPALSQLSNLKRSLTSSKSAQPNRKTPSPQPGPPDVAKNVQYVNTNNPSPQSSTFVNTLRTISLEAGRRQYGDLYDTFFYQDKKCRDRAIFLACRLRQHYDVLYDWNSNSQSRDDFIVAICSRLYAYNYILYAVPQQSSVRATFLSNLDSQCRRLGFTGPACREAVFSVGYVLQRMHGHVEVQVVEKARQVILKCLESESKLSHDERGSMYVFHGMMSGLDWDARDLDVTVEEDPMITQEILQVRSSLLARPEPIQNPFEDASAIVKEEDDDCIFADLPASSHKKVDSGFYDSYADRK